MKYIPLFYLLLLTACHPDPPAKTVKVWATPSTNYNTSPATYQFQLQFDKPVNSGAVVTLSYTKYVRDIPGVYGAGQYFPTQSSYQYNADGTTSLMIGSMDIGDSSLVEMCDFKIVAITEQNRGSYDFIIDNSMHAACALTK